MSRILGIPKVQYFKTGTLEFLSGGLLYSYVADGGTTPKATYPSLTDARALTNANTNPVVLNSRGEASVVLIGATRLVLKDPIGNVVWTQENSELDTKDIYDANKNEILKFEHVSAAVYEVIITNAATGDAPIISATGTNPNTGLKITAKRQGTLRLDAGTSTGEVQIGNTSTGTIKLNKATTITSDVTITGNASVTGTTTLTGTTSHIGNTTISGTLTTSSGLVTPSSGLAVTGNATVSANLTASGALITGATVGVNFLPSGIVMPFSGATIPTMWKLCDGAAISRTTYSVLFTAIGTAYGVGDGSTTFNLPNLQRRTIVGIGGSGTATLANTLAATGGAETHTLLTAEMPAHTHLDSQYTGTFQSDITLAGGTSGYYMGIDPTLNVGSTGGGGAHNNMKPSMVMNYIIKVY